MSCGKTSFCDYVELITSGIYGLVTILLYIYLIVVILRTAQFRHPFFYQFIILSISVSDMNYIDFNVGVRAESEQKRV